MFTSAGPWNPVRSEKCWVNSLIPWQRSVWVHKSPHWSQSDFCFGAKAKQTTKVLSHCQILEGTILLLAALLLDIFFLLHFLASFSVCSFCLRYACVLLGCVLNVDLHASTDAEVSSEELQDIESLITHLQHQHTLLGAVTQVSAHRRASLISVIHWSHTCSTNTPCWVLSCRSVRTDMHQWLKWFTDHTPAPTHLAGCRHTGQCTQASVILMIYWSHTCSTNTPWCMPWHRSTQIGMYRHASVILVIGCSCPCSTNTPFCVPSRRSVHTNMHQWF